MNRAILTANIWTMGLNLAYALVAMLIGLAALKFVDRLVFPEINLISEIKRGNIAAAIFAGMGLVFLAMVLSSAVR
jgi:uncharacterized membrane protein YjfL (UPF0719 family)